MLKYIFKRILLMVPILLVTSFIIFSGMHLASGDYVSTIEADQMTKEDYEELRESYRSQREPSKAVPEVYL